MTRMRVLKIDIRVLIKGIRVLIIDTSMLIMEIRVPIIGKTARTGRT
jgi:hypothetical protein